MRVPSSKSPSPMKSLKNLGSSSSRLSLSPVKIDHEATKALQETISSLLGKRPTLEGEDLAGAADVPNGRNGKRARPQRSKVSTDSKNLIPEKMTIDALLCSLTRDKDRILMPMS